MFNGRFVFGAAVIVAVAMALREMVPLEFIMFGLTLTGVACFHHHVLPIAVSGMTTVLAYKLAFAFFHKFVKSGVLFLFFHGFCF